MMFTNITFFWAEAVRDITRRPGGFLVSVITIALLLCFAATVLGTATQAQWLVQNVARDAAISAFLTEGASDDTALSLAAMVEDLPGVAEVRYVSPQEAQQEMSALLGPQGENLTTVAGFNPFLGYLAVLVDPEVGVEVADTAITFPGVESVRDNRQTLERLSRLTQILQVGAVAVLAFAGVVTMLAVSHIIQLGLLARREEMEIYQLLGAEPWFGAMPFILQGSVLGLLGGLVSLGLALTVAPTLDFRLEQALPFLPFMPGVTVAWQLAPLLVGAGLGFGILGSGLALWQGSNR